MNQIWEETLEYLRNNMTSLSFTSFIEPLCVHHIDAEAGIIYLSSTQDKKKVTFVRNRYREIVEAAVNECSERKWRVVIRAEQEYDSAGREDRKKDSRLNHEKLFNPRYDFDSFVVGKSNQFAHAVALAVASSPGEAYNPLFIYGGSGLGKTHLMQAIGIQVVRNNPSAKVLYVSSEMFTNELITSINEKKTRAFRNKYRKLDVLLIDDIQFLEGKEATQQEFFHTFEALHQNNKQIVITSDCPPKELKGLDERLVTRFGWNMIADVQRPDYETRVAILESFAKKDNVEITPEVYDVLCLIAERITDNVRELQGAFSRIVAFSKLLGEDINAENAKDILKDIIKEDDRAVLPQRIRIETAKYYKVRIDEMDSKKRNAEIILPRMVAMYLIRKNTDVSLPDIGKMFGGRNHATVIHAIEKIENDIKNNKQIQQGVDSIMNKTGNNPRR